MNKKGSILMAILVAGIVFASGMLIVNFLRLDVNIATADMDCNNVNISDGSKITCLGLDIGIPYFFVLIISLASGILAARLTL